MSAAAPGSLVIESVEDAASVAKSSAGAFIYAIFSFGMFAIGWSTGGLFAFVSGFFAAWGVVAIVMSIRQSVSLSRFGKVTLQVHSPLPALGGHLYASINLPSGASEATKIEGRLVLQRIYKKGMQEDLKEDWAQVWQFPVRRGNASTLLFDIPRETPGVVIPGQGELLRANWQLQVSAEIPGVDFERSFDIPMEAAVAATPSPPTVQRWTPQQAVVMATEVPPTESAPTSDVQAIATLIVFNLLPIYGVVALGWKTADIVWVYWCENLIIGVAHVIRLLAPQTVPQIMPEYVKAGMQMSSQQMLIAKAALASFFVVHYGAFCFVHAQFISAMFGARPSSHDAYFVLTILALVVSHAIMLIKDLAAGYRRVDLRTMMIRPYPRIFVVQAFVFVGALALMHSQVTALIAFIALKIGIDVYMQRWIRQMFDTRAA